MSESTNDDSPFTIPVKDLTLQTLTAHHLRLTLKVETSLELSYQQKDKRYDIRYGLGQELIRKGKYPKEFAKALSEFLAKYNHENGMVEERTAKKYGGNIPDDVRRTLRPSVQFTDIDDIVELIDRYKDSELICNLLAAYGYARAPRKGNNGDA